MIVQHINNLFRVLSDEGSTYILMSQDGEVLDNIPKRDCYELDFHSLYQELKDKRKALAENESLLAEIMEEIPQIQQAQETIEFLKKENHKLAQQLRQSYQLEPVEELPEGLEVKEVSEWIYDEIKAIQWMAEYYPEKMKLPKTEFETLIKSMSVEDKQSLNISKITHKPALVVKK